MEEKSGNDPRLTVLDPLMERLDAGDTINLQAQLKYFQNQVKGLELENARLMSEVLSYRYRRIGENNNYSIITSKGSAKETKQGVVLEEERSKDARWQEGIENIIESEQVGYVGSSQHSNALASEISTVASNDDEEEEETLVVASDEEEEAAKVASKEEVVEEASVVAIDEEEKTSNLRSEAEEEVEEEKALEKSMIASEKNINDALLDLSANDLDGLELWGSSGIGKTWMARQIMNQAMESADFNFDLAIWITVNFSGKLRYVLNQIMRQLALPELSSSTDTTVAEEEEEEEEGSLVLQIFTVLSKKKLLMVVDDMPENFFDKIEKLGILASVKQNGSKLIFTQSSERLQKSCADRYQLFVARYNLKPLNEEDAWCLFVKKAGNGVHSPDIFPLAIEVVKACEGRPRDILVAAGALRNLLQENNTTITTNTSIVSILMEAINPGYSPSVNIVQLSYDMLPSDTAKACLSYCRLLREAVNACTKVELITCWIMEGLIHGFNTFEEAYVEGNCILQEFLGRDLLESLDKDYVCMPQENNYNYWTPNVKDTHFSMEGKASLGLFANRWEIMQLEGFGRMIAHQLPSTDSSKRCMPPSTLLLSGSLWPREFPAAIYDWMLGLKVFVLFRVGIKSLPRSLCCLPKLLVFVLKDCDSLDNINNIPRLRNLVVLAILNASSLQEIPNDCFKYMTDLQSLNLSGTPLPCLPSSLSNLKKLRLLSLRGCSCLKTLPDLEALTDLKVLDLSGATTSSGIQYYSFHYMTGLRILNLSCTQIQLLPSFASFLEQVRYLKEPDHSTSNSTRYIGEKFFESMEGIEILNLSETTVEKLPFLSRLKHLRQLILKDCLQLDELSHLGACENLKVLDLSGATALREIKDYYFDRMDQLEILDLSATSVKRLTSLPTSLRQLLLRDCSSLETMWRYRLEKLKVLDLSGTTPLAIIGDNFEHLHYLQVLNLSGTSIKQLRSLPPNLRQLLLRGCSCLEAILELGTLIRLEVLDLSGACVLRDIQDEAFEHMPYLRKLNLSETLISQLPSSLSYLDNLDELLLKDCLQLQTVVNLKALPKLEVLDLSGATCLREIEDESFLHMCHLRVLDASRTPIEQLQFNHGTLHKLVLGDCSRLITLPHLEAFSELEELDLSGVSVSGEFLEITLKCMHHLQILNLSKTPIKWLSLFGLSHLQQLLLRNCLCLETLLQLEVVANLEVLDLSGTKIKEFPYVISALTRLKHLDLQNTKHLNRIDWETIKWLPEELNWDRYDESYSPTEPQEDIGKPCISVRNANSFRFLCKNSRVWEKCFQQFNLSVCLKDKDTFKQFPEVVEHDRCLNICGIDSYPSGIEGVLSNTQFLFLQNNTFITRMSDLVAGNSQMMECCAVKCNGMDSGVGGGEIEKEAADLGSSEYLSISNLERSLSVGVVRSRSFAHLKHLYVEHCPIFCIVFSSSLVLENLEILELKFCHKLEDVLGDTTSGEHVLPKLHTLRFVQLPQLQSICGGVLPSLKDLIVRNCPQLRRLPIRVNSIRSQVKIKGEWTWWKNLVWEEKDITSLSLIDFTPWRRF